MAHRSLGGNRTGPAPGFTTCSVSGSVQDPRVVTVLRGAVTLAIPSRRTRIALLLYLGCMVGIHSGIWFAAREGVATGYQDFTIFYSASQIVRQGMGHHLYDEAVEWRIQHEVAPHVASRKAALPYMHAPYEVLAFLPFSFFSYGKAYVLWNLTNLAILAALPALLKPHLPALQHYRSPLWVLSFLAFFPVFLTMLEGQDVILLLLLYTLAFVALKKNAWFSAGCWLALGLFRFQLVAPFLLVMLLKKKWKLLAGSLLTAAGLAMISAAIIGWQGVIRYPHYIWSLEHHLGRSILPPRDSANLRGLIEQVFSSWASQSVILIVVIAASAGAILLLLRKWHCIHQDESQQLDLIFSLTLLVTLLVSYHGMLYDFTLLLLPVLVVLNRILLVRPSARSARIGPLAPIAVFFFSPLYLLLWYRHWEQSNLMALVVIAWAIALSREISCHRPAGNSRPAGDAI